MIYQASFIFLTTMSTFTAKWSKGCCSVGNFGCNFNYFDYPIFTS